MYFLQASDLTGCRYYSGHCCRSGSWFTSTFIVSRSRRSLLSWLLDPCSIANAIFIVSKRDLQSRCCCCIPPACAARNERPPALSVPVSVSLSHRRPCPRATRSSVPPHVRITSIPSTARPTVRSPRGTSHVVELRAYTFFCPSLRKVADNYCCGQDIIKQL